MNKETGEPLLVNDKQVTSEKTFTPEEASGTVEVEFTFDASGLTGDIVVFEELYDRNEEGNESNMPVADHKDIEDEAQTVSLVNPESPRELSKGTWHDKTGRFYGLLIGLGALLALAAAGMSVALYQRRKMAQEALSSADSNPHH